MNLHTMIIKEFDSTTGEMLVESTGTSNPISNTAKFLSKIPPGVAGYEQAYPPAGTRCVVAQVGNQYFVLGFYKTGTVTTGNFRSNSPDLQNNYETGYKIEGTQGNHIGLDGYGNVNILAGLWSRIKLLKSFRQLVASLYSIIINLGGGKLIWTTNANKKTDFLLEVLKIEDPYSDSTMLFGEQPARREDFPNYSNKFIMKSRADDSHVIEFETRQAVDSNSPNTQVLTKYGRDSNGVHKSEYILDKDGKTSNEEILGSDNLYKHQFINGDVVVTETITNAGDVSLQVNNSASIVIDASGNISIISNDNNIFIGKQDGSRLGLLTTDFIDLFNKHTHVGPTGTDVGPCSYLTGVNPGNAMSLNIQVNDSKEQDGQFLLDGTKKIYTARTKAD